MPELRRVGDLELEQDLDFSRQDWRFQRVGMGAMVCVLFLVAMGFTGSGPLSRGEEERDGVRVRYNRFPRRDTETDLQLSVERKGHTEADIEMAVDAPEELRVSQITPEPEAMTGAPGRLRLRFRLPEAGPLQVSISFVRHGWGWRQSRFRRVSGREVAISQFVWF